MTNEAPAAPAATPSTPAEAAPPATPAPSETPPASPEPAKPATSEFTLPDEWKDKPWASKVKSQEDLYKQIDNLNTVAGKKTLTIDYANSTPEEIAAHHASLAPKDVAEYGFDKLEGVDAERMVAVAPIFQEAGITAHQAQTIATKYAKIEEAILANATSEEGFKAAMSKSFGEKYEGAVKAVVDTQKAHLSAEDQALFEAMPNDYLAGVYRLTHKMAEAHKAEIAELNKKYGVEEHSTAHLDKNGQPPSVLDVEKQRAEYRKQIRELDDRPHTAMEKQKLLDALDATYQTKGKK